MIVDCRNELEEATTRFDFFKLTILRDCSYYKPIKLRQIESDAHFRHLKRDDFCYLAYSRPRKDETFELFNLNDRTFERFVGLLAPLTMYHFSKSCKGIYYSCLDIRGLEFDVICFALGYTYVCFPGHSGMVAGTMADKRMYNYQICHGMLKISKTSYQAHAEKLSFVKNYKSLQIFVQRHTCNYRMADFCKAVFHSGIDYVSIADRCVEDEISTDPYPIMLKNIVEILGHCKNVKTLELLLKESDIVDNNYDRAQFTAVKSTMENCLAGSPRLETFLFVYKKILFQLTGGKLLRCVCFNDFWNWSEDCDLDNKTYESTNFCRLIRDRERVLDEIAYGYYDGIVRHNFKTRNC